MQFTEFIKYIPKIVKVQLPAVSAHLKMAPVERQASLEPDYYTKNNPRESAVMMLFYPRQDETCLVLIKRNSYPGVHSAQISFPGGKAEPEDKDFADTALREIWEEVGVGRHEINVVMPFTKIYIPPSNFLVYPFMGLCGKQPEFIPDPAEVNAIIELPLQVLLDDATVTSVEMKTSYSHKISVPAFIFQENIIWGATAMILSELKETLKTAFK
ncbi:CoA pyrophosphatase [Flavobacterium sp. MK4S-17]|uniref:NUDIX hydrolase n=1 Tax=Flavobacterium sp. MK4S-17 TaxID=2543737 RepID=UPI001358D475|nr:CoA pyrophosphatase [Flavobacterium sp. MK4S-17]